MDDLLAAEIHKTESALASAKILAVEAMRNYELLHARWVVLQEAALLRPAGTAQESADRLALPAPAVKHRRRPHAMKGSIYGTWRNILFLINEQYPLGAPEDAILTIAQQNGVPTLRPRDIGTRMGRYAVLGYVEKSPEGWYVTGKGLNLVRDWHHPTEP